MKDSSSNFSLMKKKLSALCLLTLLSTSCTLPDVTPPQKLFRFETDMCTLFPNRSRSSPDQDWSHCCVAHDLSYWLGGPEEKRNYADDQLKACVQKTGADEASTIMRTGVAVGGAPYFQTPWAWGFGWRRKRSYSTLTPKQRTMVLQKIPTALDVIRKLKDQWSKAQYDYVHDYLEKIRDDFKS